MLATSTADKMMVICCCARASNSINRLSCYMPGQSLVYTRVQKFCKAVCLMIIFWLQQALCPLRYHHEHSVILWLASLPAAGASGPPPPQAWSATLCTTFATPCLSFLLELVFYAEHTSRGSGGTGIQSDFVTSKANIERAYLCENMAVDRAAEQGSCDTALAIY